MSDVTHASRRWTRPEDYMVSDGGGRSLQTAVASMTRYYFHFRDDAGVVLDEDGMELTTLSDVRRKALRGARWMLAASAVSTDRVGGGAVDVCDDHGRHVLTLSLDEVEVLAEIAKPRSARA